MARTHFSVADVEAMIPALERIFTDLLQLRAGMRAVEEKLDRASAKGKRDSQPADDATSSPEIRQARAVLRGLHEALTDELERVRGMGGQIKDIETGLVDFPGRRGGDDILLCWKLGEKQIRFWHTVEGGFASRRPIDEQIARAPQRLD
ncbi:MAG TPA: DUF2203 domain-containing protein [Polyangia bacterium]|nr:DUF2203 domain-containing protein [Polyangia bacterium]